MIGTTRVRIGLAGQVVISGRNLVLSPKASKTLERLWRQRNSGAALKVIVLFEDQRRNSRFTRIVLAPL